jgi:DNA primase catalytic core
MTTTKGPKYLNTPETALYHKNQVLYGLDLAKKSIAKTKRVVVVEGYTDVMAAHLAGVEQAVATCGTAFGAEHVKIIRRLLGDDPTGQVIFTFDGDAAGQKAALKAFEFESLFTAQTFVAVEPDGLDPCDLRMQKGDAALRELIDGCKPLFEFVITTAIARFDLDTVEGPHLRGQGRRRGAHRTSATATASPTTTGSSPVASASTSTRSRPRCAPHSASREQNRQQTAEAARRSRRIVP